MSPQDWVFESDELSRRAAQWIEEQRPQLVEDAPRVRFMCPSCDRLIADVWLELDGFGRPILATSPVMAAGFRPATPSTPSGGAVVGLTFDGNAELDAGRYRLVCRNRRCRYTGDQRLSRLLVVYAIAAGVGQREAVIPT